MSTKNEILEYLDNVLHPLVSPEHWDVYSELHDMVEDLPSADRPHGKWQIEISKDGHQATYQCGECGHRFKWIYDPLFPPVFNYCQKCGADMMDWPEETYER